MIDKTEALESVCAVKVAVIVGTAELGHGTFYFFHFTHLDSKHFNVLKNFFTLQHYLSNPKVVNWRKCKGV